MSNIVSVFSYVDLHYIASLIIMNYGHTTDSELASLLRQRDQEAFRELFERYKRVLYSFAKNMTHDISEAEDLVQDVFISLWENAERLELKGTISSYLYAAVRYKFLNLVAHKKIRSDYVSIFQKFINEVDYSVDEYLNEKELINLVEKEVSKLPDKMREVFELSRNAGLSHREIAGKLNLSEKTVKNHINHALKILRGKLPLSAILLYLLQSL